jgi:alkaline phosphatase D
MRYRIIGDICLACLLFAVLTPDASSAPRKPSSLHKPKQYKRTHQAALEMITKGDAERAIKGLEAHAKTDPKDAETQYMLAVAYAKVGHTQKALAATERALDLGLPAARFVAGTRTGLENLRKEKAYITLIEQFRGRPAYGPMLGCVTGKSVKVWLRTVGAASVKVEYGLEATLKDAKISPAVRTSAGTDFTAVVDVTDLKPNTAYYYRVAIEPGGTNPNPAKIHHFRTIAPVGKSGKLRIAFGGGAGFVPKNERAWDTVAKQQPQALLLLGDNVYSDMPTSPEMQHFCYYRRQSRPEFRRLVASVPVYSIWDDHDFSTNDSWGGPEIDTPEWKRPVWNVFRNNWVNPAYGGGEKQPGCWYDFYLGDVHFIMLDGRYYRTSPKVEEDQRSMLGPVQKKWLFDTLAGSKGTFKVLCSPVPWDYRTKGGSPDTWNGYQKERDEIFAFLDKNDVEGVLLMSADRHRSDLWKIQREGTYPLYEFNSSRLTNQHVHSEMKEAEFSYNKKQSFGTVDFDTTSADPTATYTVLSIDGEKVHNFTVKRSQLK